MPLKHNALDIIRGRSSHRTYQPRPIESAIRATFEDEIATPQETLFGSKVRLRLVSATESDRSSLRGLGTYGMIKNAPAFLIGCVEESPTDLEDFGYVMESALLRATDLGLGTCWLGGSFTKSAFAEKIGTSDRERVPAVLALGHSHDRRTTIDKLVRWGAKSAKRRSWERLFFSGSFGIPLAPENAGELSEALEMVRLGPSASNKQPWNLIKSREEEDTFHLFLRRTPGYRNGPKFLGMDDLQRVDMGIAMCHFSLAAEALGKAGTWEKREKAPAAGTPPELTEYVATWS